MRIYSYLFHAVLAFFLCGVAMVALINGAHSWQLELLPWQGKTLTIVMLCGGLLGGISVLLAIWGKLRALLLVWSVLVVLFLIRGFIFTSYHFNGVSGFLTAMFFVFAAAFAALGAWLRFRQKPAGLMAG